MSATWMRAHELGQPLTLRVIGVSSWSVTSASRRSSSAIAVAAVALVSTMASLQYSMPVQAIVCRRNGLGHRETEVRSSRRRGRSTASGGRRARRASGAAWRRTPVGAGGARRVGEAGEHVAAGGRRPGRRRRSGCRPSAGARRRGRRDRWPAPARAVGELVAEVLGLEHLAELLGAPLGEEELQPGLGAQPAVAVVAEDRG